MKNGSRVLRCCGEGCTTTIRVGMGVAAVLCSRCSQRNIADRIDRAMKAKKKEAKEET